MNYEINTKNKSLSGYVGRCRFKRGGTSNETWRIRSYRSFYEKLVWRWEWAWWVQMEGRPERGYESCGDGAMISLTDFASAVHYVLWHAGAWCYKGWRRAGGVIGCSQRLSETRGKAIEFPVNRIFGWPGKARLMNVDRMIICDLNSHSCLTPWNNS